MTGLLRWAKRCIGAALAMAMVSTLAASEEVWKMSTRDPAEGLEGRAYQHFANLVEEYTNGELKVQVYPSEQLGTRDAVLEQLQAGIVHIFASGVEHLGVWNRSFEYTNAPFVFDDLDHWIRFMNSDLVMGWLRDVEQEAGVTVLGDMTRFPRGPYRVLVSSRPIDSLDDVHGLRLRMYENPMVAGVWTTLGAEVRILPWTEVYQSIRTGIVEALTSPILLVEDNKFYEVAPYITRTDEFPQSVTFMINKQAYDGLSPELREAVDRAFADASDHAAQLQEGAVEQSLARMATLGVDYKEIDVAPFVARTQDFYAERQRTGVLPDGFLEAVAATR
jgi:TRAP-type transport system periplasmic protein